MGRVEVAKLTPSTAFSHLKVCSKERETFLRTSLYKWQGSSYCLVWKPVFMGGRMNGEVEQRNVKDIGKSISRE